MLDILDLFDRRYVRMAPTREFSSGPSGVERVRHELLTALHFGRLTPGDRVPSVRNLATQTGMNRKTVHRAYTRLAREGLLVLRPGSGTFIAEQSAGTGGVATISDLVLAANRCRATADGLGLDPRLFSRFLDIYLANGFRGVALTAVECNREQLALVESGLRGGLGVTVHPVLLANLAGSLREASRRTRGIVTTECHWAEVEELAADHDLPIYRIALDPEFPRRLVEQSRSGPVVMIVRDGSFRPIFLKLLRQMSVPEDQLRRFHVVEVPEARASLKRIPAGTTVYVSPLVEREGQLDFGQVRPLRLRWRFEPSSLDRLKVALALELAQRRHGDEFPLQSSMASPS